MDELDPKKKRNLLRLAKMVEEGDIAIFEHLVELEEELGNAIEDAKKKVDEAVVEVKASVPNIKDLLEQVKGKDGKDGETVVGPKGEDGKDGKDGKTIVGPQGPAGKDGKDGVSPDLDTIAYEASKRVEAALTPLIPKIEDIEKDLPKLGERIRDSLELLPVGSKLSIEAIEDLREELDKIIKRITSVPGVGGGSITGTGARNLFDTIDLSSQLDGVTKTFNIHAVWNVLSVDIDSYPYGAMAKVSDYTWTPTSITFGDSVDAATQLSAGMKCLLTVVNP